MNSSIPFSSKLDFYETSIAVLEPQIVTFWGEDSVEEFLRYFTMQAESEDIHVSNYKTCIKFILYVLLQETIQFSELLTDNTKNIYAYATETNSEKLLELCKKELYTRYKKEEFSFMPGNFVNFEAEMKEINDTANACKKEKADLNANLERFKKLLDNPASSEASRAKYQNQIAKDEESLKILIENEPSHLEWSEKRWTEFFEGGRTEGYTLFGAAALRLSWSQVSFNKQYVNMDNGHKSAIKDNMLFALITFAKRLNGLRDECLFRLNRDGQIVEVVSNDNIAKSIIEGDDDFLFEPL